MKFGLIGNPVAHSLSPNLFRAAYPNNNHTYELILTSDPEEAVNLLIKGGFTAVNVTAPIKTSILPFIQKQTPECVAIGACNLVLKQGDTLVAHNTDYIGVTNSITKVEISMINAVCLLLGAGGAAKAAAYALLQLGSGLIWANRTLAHIPDSFNGSFIITVPLSEAVHHLQACNIIINTLPLSIPDTDVFTFHAHHTVFDASYVARPLEEQAIQAGAKYLGGERWLLHQAIPSFEAMTGIVPNIYAMEDVITFCHYPNIPYFSGKFKERLWH